MLTINAERLRPTDDTTITFAEVGAKQPAPILSWFYPGSSSGHEFLYSHSQEKEFAQVKHGTVMVAARGQRQTAVAGD